MTDKYQTRDRASRQAGKSHRFRNGMPNSLANLIAKHEKQALAEALDLADTFNPLTLPIKQDKVVNMNDANDTNSAEMVIITYNHKYGRDTYVFHAAQTVEERRKQVAIAVCQIIVVNERDEFNDDEWRSLNELIINGKYTEAINYFDSLEPGAYIDTNITTPSSELTDEHVLRGMAQREINSLPVDDCED